MPLVEITDRRLDLNRHLEAVKGPGFGAVVTFIGQIRDHDPEAEREVERLEYSAHPEASIFLERIVEEVGGPELKISVSHRIGVVEVGEPALVSCVAAAHRAEAYEASRLLIERVKAEVPIWKRQIEAGGKHNWQGLN